MRLDELPWKEYSKFWDVAEIGGAQVFRCTKPIDVPGHTPIPVGQLIVHDYRARETLYRGDDHLFAQCVLLELLNEKGAGRTTNPTP